MTAKLGYTAQQCTSPHVVAPNGLHLRGTVLPPMTNVAVGLHEPVTADLPGGPVLIEHVTFHADDTEGLPMPAHRCLRTDPRQGATPSVLTVPPTSHTVFR